MTTITNEIIAKLESKGFRRWTKGNMDRLYISASDYGVEFDRYSNGRVSGGEFAGEQFGAYEARNFVSSKVYIDVKTGKLSIQTRTDFEDKIRAAVEAIIAECTESEPETEERKYDENRANMVARITELAEDNRKAVHAKCDGKVDADKIESNIAEFDSRINAVCAYVTESASNEWVAVRVGRPATAIVMDAAKELGIV